MNYAHTQRSPLWWLLVTFGVATTIAAWLNRDQSSAALVMLSISAAMFLLSLSLTTLTVADEGESLAIRFGPLPLFRKRIAYATISDVEPTQSAVIDGWGIHCIPGRGWTWNLWGRSCVRMKVNGRTLRIGSNDADNLAMFLRSKTRA